MKPVYLAVAIHIQIAMHLVAKRIKAACRTNEPQATFVIGFTGFNIMAIAPHNASAQWPHPAIILLCLTFWPVVAFLINLISPLPIPDKPLSNKDKRP